MWTGLSLQRSEQPYAGVKDTEGAEAVMSDEEPGKNVPRAIFLSICSELLRDYLLKNQCFRAFHGVWSEEGPKKVWRSPGQYPVMTRPGLTTQG